MPWIRRKLSPTSLAALMIATMCVTICEVGLATRTFAQSQLGSSNPAPAELGSASVAVESGASPTATKADEILRQEARQAGQKLVEAANNGDPRAQATLGVIYFDGLGVPKDRDKALKWLVPAAHARRPEALIRISEAFDDKLKTASQDERSEIFASRKLMTAEAWKSATQLLQSGDLQATIVAAYLMINDDLDRVGIKRDFAEAEKLLRTAADQGNAEAMERLARLYDLAGQVVGGGKSGWVNGEFKSGILRVPNFPRRAEASQLHFAAAQLGYPRAITSLARIYALSGEKDLGRQLLEQALSLGDEGASQELEALYGVNVRHFLPNSPNPFSRPENPYRRPTDEEWYGGIALGLLGVAAFVAISPPPTEEQKRSREIARREHNMRANSLSANGYCSRNMNRFLYECQNL